MALGVFVITISSPLLQTTSEVILSRLSVYPIGDEVGCLAATTAEIVEISSTYHSNWPLLQHQNYIL